MPTNTSRIPERILPSRKRSSKKYTGQRTEDPQTVDDTQGPLPDIDSPPLTGQPSGGPTHEHDDSHTPTQISHEVSPSGSATPTAGSSGVDGRTLIQRLQDLSWNLDDTDERSVPGLSIEAAAVRVGVATQEVLATRSRIYDEDAEVSENHTGIPGLDNASLEDLWPTMTTLNVQYLPIDTPDSSIKTLFEVLCVSIPKLPAPYDDGALRQTKQVSKTEINLNIETQLRKVVFVPGLVCQLFKQAEDKLRKFPVDWNDPSITIIMGHIHPAHTSIGQPDTIWSEADAVTWAGNILSRPAARVLHAVLDNHLGKHNGRKYPNVASCHHKDRVVPDMAVVRSGNNAENVKLSVTIEVKNESAYRDEDEVGKFDNLQILASDDHLGQAMLFNWPEAIPENDTQTRMLTQVSLVVDFIKTPLTLDCRCGHRW